MTSNEEFHFLVEFFRKVNPNPKLTTLWVGGVALGKDEEFVWFGSGAKIPKDQLKMEDPSKPDYGYCVRLGSSPPKPDLKAWDCGRERWYICKY